MVPRGDSLAPWLRWTGSFLRRHLLRHFRHGIDLVRRPAVERRVRASAIVVVDPGTDTAARLAADLESVEEDAFVFEAAPPPINEDVVHGKQSARDGERAEKCPIVTGQCLCNGGSFPMRIIYPTDDGGVAVLIPAGAIPGEEVARKDVPAGVPFRIVED